MTRPGQSGSFAGNGKNDLPHLSEWVMAQICSIHSSTAFFASSRVLP